MFEIFDREKKLGATIPTIETKKIIKIKILDS
jgi:hypothetical protein